MQSVCRSFFVLFLLGFFTVASAQLPPEIRADAYLLQAEQAIRNGDSFRAQAAIQNILRLQKEYKLDLSDEFHFRYAKIADAVDLFEQALESVVKYLTASGREGQHYVEALALMNKVKDRSSGDVVASQLSPNIIADAYLMQAEQSIRDDDHNRARDAVQDIRNLQEQHELDLSDEFHFRYAKAADVLNLPDQALESVLKSLAASGREGQHYVEALALMNKVQTAVSCKGWDTVDYFKTATLEEVTACLDTGVNLEVRDNAGLTPLHRAAKNTENLDVIKVLINAGADKDARNNDKRTPLHGAVTFNNPVAVRGLIEAGANLDVQDKDKETPLHQAVKNTENLDVVKALIEAGADLEVKGNNERTPLGNAVSFWDRAAIEVLIEAGANRARAKDTWTSLHWAAAYNENPVAIQALLNTGANPKAKDDAKQTPLHIAAKFGNLVAIKVLLDGGADLKAKAKDNQRPLHLAAAYSENPDIVKVLINAGADLKAKAKDNQRPLHLAAAYSENPDIVKVLINAGADLKAKAKDKNTPLHVAARYNDNPDILKVLIDAGADLNADADDDWIPLHAAAAYSDNLDVVKVLIDAGANPNAHADDYWTPLHVAARYNDNPDILKVLIDAGANPNAHADRDWTPLHMAARYNDNPDILKVLIDAGADLKAEDSYAGESSLEKAAGYNENPDVVKVLIDAGAGISDALEKAARYNDNPDVVKVLIDAGAYVEKGHTSRYWTPLHFAAWRNRNPDILKVLIDAGANPNVRDDNGKGDTPLDLAKRNNNRNAERFLRAAGARKSKGESGLGKTAIALLGGAAIGYAGGGSEESIEAARQFMEGVINEQPVGSGNTSSAATSSQTQGGQSQGTMQQALQNLENVCGEKYQGNFADNDHYRFYCMAAFNDYCALKRAQSSEAINKLRASLQQNCAVLKSVGADSKCSYCK